MAPRPAGHYDMNVLGPPHYRHHSLVVIPVNPAGPQGVAVSVPPVNAAQLEQRQRLPRQFVQVRPHIVLAPAGARDDVGVFRPQRQQHIAHHMNVIAAGYGH